MQVRKSEEMVFIQEMKTIASAKFTRSGLHPSNEDHHKGKNQKKWSSLLQKVPL
ncbi:hypothetical protein [Metabacillus sp. B2-18]|uniref:hypothetical protein n=1 Tax=Metabacillus sp. B2-18 TaxID=2897333 RepID=UPI001E3DDC15|nr:hypothetical protein [Metabacillus sp. B2-18]UGB31750.1 hypothetical protein LPC09_04510 [Metabacillus sp. B2-18]